MPVLALSTAESELAAVTKGLSEGLGAESVFRDYGRKLKVHVLSDATAAIGICRRQGLGRIRHLAVSDLWCQELIKSKLATISKWPGKENPADLFTKHLGRVEIISHLGRMGMHVKAGRAKSAPVRAGTSPQVVPAEFDSERDISCDSNLCIPSNEVFCIEGHDGLGGGKIHLMILGYPDSWPSTRHCLGMT